MNVKLLLPLLFVTVALAQTYEFVAANGTQITTIQYDPIAYGYIDSKVNGFLKVCDTDPLPLGVQLDLYYTDEENNLSNPHISVTTGPRTITSYFVENGNYCTLLDFEISPFQASYPGKVKVAVVGAPYAGDLDLLLNGTFRAFITTSPNNISIILNAYYGDDNIDTLRPTVRRQLIVLNLVNLSNNDVLETKLVRVGETYYFSKPADFTLDDYGKKYMFYANGLPVGLENCTSCEGMPDGTSCSFNLNASNYGCVSPTGDGVCVAGVCRPLCDPSKNYNNSLYPQYGENFNDLCYTKTDGLKWFACCPEGNQYHVCVYNVSSDCETFCGDIGKPCCDLLTQAPYLCRVGVCVCTINETAAGVQKGTKCVLFPNMQVGSGWIYTELYQWDIQLYKATQNPGMFFWFNPADSKYYSCCPPDKACIPLFKPAPQTLPHLCPVELIS